MKFYNFHLFPWPGIPDDFDLKQYFTPEKWALSGKFFDPKIATRVMNEYLDQCAYSEQVGLDGVIFNEHHQSAPYNAFTPSPNIVAAAIAHRTKRFQIGVLGNALPLHGSPVRIAEEYAMLDVMTGGRLIAGFVRAGASEYVNMGINPAESKDRFMEAWDLIMKAWTTEEPFSWEGKFYHHKHVCIWPRPVQKPHPPVWVPTTSGETLEMAAKKRVTLPLSFLPTDKMKKVFDKFRDLAKEEGYTATKEQFATLRVLYVADTDKQAVDEARKHFDYYRRASAATNNSDNLPGYNAPEAFANYVKMRFDWKGSLEDLIQSGQVFVGSPETVVERIRYEAKELGLGSMLFFLQFGSLPNELAMRNLKMVGETVLPKIRNL